MDWRGRHGDGMLGKSCRCPVDLEHQQIRGLVVNSADIAIDVLVIDQEHVGPCAARQADECLRS